MNGDEDFKGIAVLKHKQHAPQLMDVKAQRRSFYTSFNGMENFIEMHAYGRE
jgi:hypothetical protein